MRFMTLIAVQCIQSMEAHSINGASSNFSLERFLALGLDRRQCHDHHPVPATSGVRRAAMIDDPA
jgi:hypothetical protein